MDPWPRSVPSLSGVEPSLSPGPGLDSGLDQSQPCLSPGPGLAQSQPCLIVEDSQPDSLGPEDDPESSYRALLKRRLSVLQPHSPVLELLQSPGGSRESQSNSQSQPPTADTEMHRGFEESEDASHTTGPEEVDSRASQSLHHEEGTSQFGFLELSQSQDFGSEPVQNQTGTKTDEPSSDKSKTCPKSQSRPGPGPGPVPVESQSRPGPGPVPVESQSRPGPGPVPVESQSRPGPGPVPVESWDRDQELLSSQEDLFDKPGPGRPGVGPSQSLALLQLSGAVQGTLVNNSLSQSSVDFVAPTPENLTPMIVPSSPTDHSEEPMDTSGPAPSPVRHTPVLERPLSVPSQPDLSHDVFVPTQSQDQSSSPIKPLSASSAPVRFSESSAAVSLNLSVNSKLHDDDEEATQIEQLDETYEKPASQNVPKPLNAGSQNSVKAQSQEANDQPDPSQRELNANSQDATVNHEKSQGSPKMQPTGSVPEVATASQAKIVNVNREKQSANANTLPTGSVRIKEAVIVGSQTKKMNVYHEETVQNMSQGSANARAQTTGSVQEASSSQDSANARKQPTGSVQEASSSQDSANARKQPTGSVQEASSNQGSANARKKPTGSVHEASSSQESANARKQTTGSVNKMSSSQESANARKQPTGSVQEASSSQGSTKATGSVDDVVIVGSQTKELKEKSENLVGNVSLDGGHVTEAEKDSSLGLVLSQSEVIVSGTRQDGDKMAAARAGAKSLDSSGDISFHFTLPKEGDLIGRVSATPPLISQLKPSSLRHSTPIEVNSISQNSSDLMMAEGSDVIADGADGKLSLRMKLVTPVEEGSSERFSLQKPNLSDEDHTVSRSSAQTLQNSPSVFSRVRQVHRQEQDSPVRGALFSSPQRNSIGFNSLPDSQSDCSEVTSHTPSSAANQNGAKNLSQNAPGAGHKKVDLETPPPTRPGPAHRRHVRTVQEVRTTVTRIITDVYYEDGTEVDRTVTTESEEPVVQYQVLDVSPSRTGTSLTSGDLADISFSTCTTGTTSSSATGTSSSSATGTTSTERPEFLPPPNRAAKPSAPPVADSPPVPDQGSSGSSFVGLRVVAKWSSNGYFYSGRIIADCGTRPGPGPDPGLAENRFRLRFDDGYECELWARDILLCDPLPKETQITALNQDQTYSTGVIKDHKTEGGELLYCVETRGETRLWFSRTAVILSLEQGNRLREQHGLGPSHPGTALPKAADISLDNLVEGKRKRRGAAVNTPPQALSSPRGSHLRPGTSPGPSPGPSPGSKRKLRSERTTPAKRGRRGAVQQVSALNTSDSGSDLGPGSGSGLDLVSTHGPLPQNHTLFEGFVFILTASSERDRLTNQDQDQEDPVQTGPYSKTYTETQLQTGGGIVLREFNQQQCEAAYQSLCVADVHCRTRSYLLCVASGVPCVSHLWVRDCCRDNTLHNHRHYLLPTGTGPDHRAREWRPRSSPFRSLRVLLVLQDQVQFWSELIRLGGGSAHIHQPDSESSSGSLDVVVSDSGWVQLRSKPGLDQVSVEWILQSVVCGQSLDYTLFSLRDPDSSS